MNSEEILNPDFDINAKYEDMIERAKHNIDLYLETGKDCSDISLSYDVKNYLPKALEEIEKYQKHCKSWKQRAGANGKCLKEYIQENYRLNNIIDELEKWINTEIAIHIDDDILPIVYECILSKLKELKEGK